MQTALEDWRVDLLREINYPFVMIGRTANNDGLAPQSLGPAMRSLRGFHMAVIS
jgi:hypothetical protein